MNCKGIIRDYPKYGVESWNYDDTWILVEYDNGEAHWTLPCRKCNSELCKKLAPDAHIVGRVETVNMRS